MSGLFVMYCLRVATGILAFAAIRLLVTIIDWLRG